MRLADKEPRWVAIGYPGFVEKANAWAQSLPIYCGVSFMCPHCNAQRLAVIFDPPVNPAGHVVRDAPPVPAGQLVWKRDGGDTFDTLTLSPSLDFSRPARIDFAGHWHGFIKNGELT